TAGAATCVLQRAQAPCRHARASPGRSQCRVWPRQPYWSCPMNFEIDATELAIIDSAERVCRDVLAANAQRYDEEESFCAESLQALGELGFMGINLPETYGGFGIGSLAMSRVVEAVSAACASTASALTAHFLATDSILIGGTEEQRQEWLPRCASGELL